MAHRPRHRRLCPGSRLLLLALSLLALPVQAAGFDAALEQLVTGSFRDKGEAVTTLANSGRDAATPLLKALLEGDLYIRKSDDRLVLAASRDGGYALTDAVSGDALGEVGRRDVKKVRINNQLRGQIRAALAELQLGNPDPGVRRGAVRELFGELDDATAARLRERQQDEPASAVREAIGIALALHELGSDDAVTRRGAAAALSGVLDPTARARLNAVAANDPDLLTRDTAGRALRASEKRVAFYAGLETLFFGLSLGSVLVLAAIGLAITFGVMGVINMAHGELIMLGAYTTYVVQLLMPNHIDVSLFVAVPAAFLVSGLFGIAIERGVIRFLYGRPLETLLATFGVSLVLQQLVRTVFSPLNRSVETPSWMSGSIEINSVLSLTLNRAWIILFCLLVFSALLLVLRRTRLGLQMRAVTQNRAMARAMGVRSARVDALTFGLGSGVAGIAGVALSQLTNVGPNLGQNYIIDSFMVVVFGGVGNLWGMLVSGMTLGVANKILEPWSGAVLAKILILVAIILFIQKRPRGLFPQKGRAAEA
ncbi:MAG: urea ABC transporter permease subunit UrtB [Gammaproteobacteria bacterium]|nr:urea ABC transporter permease subunit UrtB [Gammaproteobacteria bacterium]